MENTKFTEMLNDFRETIARHIPMPRSMREMVLQPKIDALRASKVIEDKFQDALDTFTAFFQTPLILDRAQMYCTRNVYGIPLRTIGLAANAIRVYGFRLDVTETSEDGFKVQMVADLAIANYNYTRLMNPAAVDHSAVLLQLKHR